MENESSEPAVKFTPIEPGWSPEPGENIWNSVLDKFARNLLISVAAGARGQDGEAIQGPQGPPGQDGQDSPLPTITVTPYEECTAVTNGESDQTIPLPATATDPAQLNFYLKWTGENPPVSNTLAINRIELVADDATKIYFNETVTEEGWEICTRWTAVELEE